MRKYRVALVGATGLIGQEFLKILQDRHFPLASLDLLGTERSVGRKVFFNGEEIEIREATAASFVHKDIVFFGSPDSAKTPQHFAPAANKAGALVIDVSSAFRMEPGVPLVVPEINLEDARRHRGIISSPDSASVQVSMALWPLHKVNPIRRVVVATYQSVSQTSAAAIQELSSEVKQILEGNNAVPHVYPHQIAFNVIPECAPFYDNGYTQEEWKLMQEVRKIMHADDLPVCATCARVPVYIGHSAALHIEFANPFTPEDARAILAESQGTKVLDDPSISLYPHPWSVAGSDSVYVGRVRQDICDPRALAVWVVMDNLRKGGALNAIQIAEGMMAHEWL